MRKTVVVLLALVTVLALVAVATASTTSSAAAQTGTATPAATAAATTAAPAATKAPAATTAAQQGGAAQATPNASAQVETCSICHNDDGYARHQAEYDQLYQDGVVQVSNIKYAFTANPDTVTVTFNLTKNGQPLDPKQTQGLSIYWVPFVDGNFQWEPERNRLSLKGTLTADGKGLVTSKLVEKAKDAEGYEDLTDISKTAGVLAVYGRNETIGTIPGTRVAQNKYPFMGILETGAGVEYESTANDAGCVACHTDPYLKHGYIYAQVNDDPTTDFIPCKVCHIDNAEGEHTEWQLLVDNPELAAEYLAAPEEERAGLLTDEQKALYAYNPSVMNDVHMSHAMEFPYPQKMSNCVTCHEGKLDRIITDENFNAAQCKSCHPVTGAKAEAAEGEEPAWDTTVLALETLIGENHPPIDWADPTDASQNCSTCHKNEGGLAPGLAQIHPGYDEVIFAEEGIKYSDVITVSIDSAEFDANKLDITFTANVSETLDVDLTESITPTVLVSLYGWDTKDFIIGAHERGFDDNKDGKIDSSDLRNLEADFGQKTPNPRVAIESTGDLEWSASVDLTNWANLIENDTVRRVEIGILPSVVISDTEVAVDAVTRTFDLGAGDFDDEAFREITDVNKCESCHGALAINFHSPSYGGDVVACRMCHITKAGGSHLELQSRSIDSYAHAVHSMQVFDVADIAFDSEVAAMHYEEHTSMPYPTHGIENCESCHVEGVVNRRHTYDAPTEAMSLPGLLSASADNETMDRAIEGVPAYVTGPAERACGGCHRAQAINTDDFGQLRMLNQHFEMGGYLLPAGQKPVDTLMAKINEVMALFGR